MGCHIEDLASDPDVNDFIEQYRTARMLYDANEIPALLERKLEQLGLMEETEFLIRLEVIYSEYKQLRRARAQDALTMKKWSR